MFPVILTINNPQYGKSKSRPALATWYVDFMIKVSDVGFRLSSVASAHQNKDLGSGLANISFACDTEHRWYGNMDNISGIIVSCGVLYMRFRSLDMHWQPVSVEPEPGGHCN